MIKSIENIYKKNRITSKNIIIKRKNSYFCSIFWQKLKKILQFI